ncbi:MAG: hypothetical protein ACKOBV_04970, partial [Candidatus Kapaibacterium sp.]
HEERPLQALRQPVLRSGVLLQKLVIGLYLHAEEIYVEALVGNLREGYAVPQMNDASVVMRYDSFAFTLR